MGRFDILDRLIIVMRIKQNREHVKRPRSVTVREYDPPHRLFRNFKNAFRIIYHRKRLTYNFLNPPPKKRIKKILATCPFIRLNDERCVFLKRYGISIFVASIVAFICIHVASGKKKKPQMLSYRFVRLIGDNYNKFSVSRR